MADFTHFARIDPFHERVIVQAADLRPGVDLILVHRILGFRFLRFGRLLTWREGHGYAFSDLSGRDKRQGFPHVFFCSVESVGDSAQHGSRLTVCVRGKWTSPWASRRVGMWWLRYVCYEHARLLRKVLRMVEKSAPVMSDSSTDIFLSALFQRPSSGYCLRCGEMLHPSTTSRCPRCLFQFNPDDPQTFAANRERFQRLKCWLPGFCLSVVVGVGSYAVLALMGEMSMALFIAVPMAFGTLLG